MRSLILAASMIVAVPAFAANADSMPVRSITVNGEAERKIVPDEAHIRVNLNSQDKQMAAAKAAHDTKITKLMGVIKNAGIDEKKVRTESSSTQPIYHYVGGTSGQPSKRVFDGYRVQSSLDITVADTKKLGELMETIAGSGFEQGSNEEWGDLMSMYYTLLNPDAIRDEMLADAIGNAKKKAERMATAAGASVGAVYEIREAGTPSFQPIPMPMMARAAAPMVEKASIAPPAGEQQVQSNVTVTYELK